VISVGNFDGLHLGQQALLEGVVLRVIAPGRAPQRICSDRQRDRLLGAAGVDTLWLVPFTAEFASRSAESFVRDLLVDRLAMLEVHVGSRFAFGRGREGDLELLRGLGGELGFAAHGVAEVQLDGAPVSSTRIRAALAEGEVERATRLLGRPFARAGTIVAGDRLGSRLGWPTANLEADADLLPAHGVYAAKLRRIQEGEGEAMPGVANVGVRPTRGGEAPPRIEIHLFDFDGDLYDAEVEIEFHHLLRGERRFPDLEALAAQIAADAGDAREYFAGSERSHGSTGVSR
jgi:riboflavin kinase/FMN adenylyltransferase